MLKRYFHIVLLIIIHYGGVAQVNDQTGTPLIYNYSSVLTQSEPQNWAIVEDHRGIIYFGNGPETGVLEFDGNSWHIINISNHSTARSLAIDNLGKIFVGASKEFGYLAADSSGTLKYVSLTHLIPDTEIEFNNILKVHTTSHGIYFIATNVIFRYYNTKIDIIEGNYIQRFGFNINDRLFVANEENGLMFIRNNKFEKLPYTKSIIQGCGRYVIMEYTNNKLLIATVNNGIFVYDLNRIIHKGKIFEKNTEENTAPDIAKKLKTNVNKYLMENALYTCAKINDNAYAYGTLGGGIIIMDKAGNLVRVINKNRGLIDNTVLGLYADEANNLWVATYQGISYVETGSPLSVYNELNGLHGTVISLIKHQNKRFVGTTQGIFYLPDYNPQYIDDNYILIPVSNFDTECWNFITFQNKLLAAGADGIYLINELQAKRIYETSEIYCFKHNNIFPDYLFLGLTDIYGFELIKNSKKNNPEEIKISSVKKFFEITDKIRKIENDKHNSLWLTTEYSGIIRIRFNDGDINKYKIFRYDTAQGLPQLNYNWVYNIEGEIIVGTRKGFYKPIYNQNNNVKKFVPDTSFGKQFTLGDIPVEDLYISQDQDAYIFLKNHGVGVLFDYKNKKEWNTQIFGKIKEPYKTFYDSDSILWISTLNEGLFSYNNSISKNYNASFNTMIRKVHVGKDSLVFNGSFFDDSSKTANVYSKILLNRIEVIIRTG